jgi:hypothetical protein
MDLKKRPILKETHSWHTDCVAGDITDWRLIHRDAAK